MFYKMLMVLLTVISIGFPKEQAEFGKWRWAEDTMQLTHDKETHAVGSFGLYYLFVNKGMSKSDAINTVFWLGLMKEGIDALVPWEEYDSWGGDGFSKNDVAYNTIGLASAYLIDRLWESKINENKSTYIEIYPRSIRISIYLN